MGGWCGWLIIDNYVLKDDDDMRRHAKLIADKFLSMGTLLLTFQ